MEETLVKSTEELIREVLEADGWTPEQIAMAQNDPDAVAALLGD